MGDWIGLGVIVSVLAVSLLGLSHLGKPRAPLSEEEFERRAAESRGTMSAGVAGMMYALQKLMNPKAAEAVETQKDLRAGYYDETEQAGEGDGEEAGVGVEPAARKHNQQTQEEGADA